MGHRKRSSLTVLTFCGRIRKGIFYAFINLVFYTFHTKGNSVSTIYQIEITYLRSGLLPISVRNHVLSLTSQRQLTGQKYFGSNIFLTSRGQKFTQPFALGNVYELIWRKRGGKCFEFTSFLVTWVKMWKLTSCHQKEFTQFLSIILHKEARGEVIAMS